MIETLEILAVCPKEIQITSRHILAPSIFGEASACPTWTRPTCNRHVAGSDVFNSLLGDGFKHFLFSPLPGKMNPFD